MSWLVMFAVGLGISAAWTETVAAVRDGRAMAAGLWTVALDAVTMATTWWVVSSESVPSLVAYAIGGGLGTALAVKRSRR